MELTIAILEDNVDRRTAMELCLEQHAPNVRRQFFIASMPMVEWLNINLQNVVLISLDHDLDLIPDEVGRLVDSGTGREVADFLARQRPWCPVIIHSTNYPAAIAMEALLTENGWGVERITPYGDLEWIGEAWLPVARKKIKEFVFTNDLLPQTFSFGRGSFSDN